MSVVAPETGFGEINRDVLDADFPVLIPGAHLDYILIADKNLSRWRGGGYAHRESESYERD